MVALSPGSVEELAGVIREAAEVGRLLEIRGAGTKSGTGAPRPHVATLEMGNFAGVADYDPAELVVTVGAGTPLCDVEKLLAREGQMLAFEPLDYGPLLGSDAGVTTIGGVIAAAASGSRRLTKGGVRDHVLGFTAVSGRGESFAAGGKVIKNVTGYDLSKLITGSWGRLAALTEITLKVAPAPAETVSCVAYGLDPTRARELMSRALSSQAEVCAAAHIPGSAGDHCSAAAMTVFRLEGFGSAVTARATMLESHLAVLARLDRPSAADAARIWDHVRTLAPLHGGRRLWRISIPARAFPAIAVALRASGTDWLADWGGGLIWASYEGDANALRALVGTLEGHAALVKAEPLLRASVPPFHPRQEAVAALEARVRRAFDPAGVFETGRFLDHSDEN